MCFKFSKVLSIVAFLAGSVSALSQPKSDVEVDLQFNEGRTAIMASINGGAPQQVNYDTGAQGMMIRESFAQALGLPVIGEALLGSPHGGEPVAVKIVALNSLRVGGIESKPGPRVLDAVVVPDEKFLSNAKLILGNNQFPGTLIELDFPKQKFRLRNPSDVNTEGWTATDGRGLLSGTLDVAGSSVPLHIDSGNPGYVVLPMQLTQKLKLLSPLQEAGSIKTVDRTLPTQSARIDSDVKIAGANAVLRGEVRFGPFPFANLGTAALRTAVVQIDTARGRWMLAFDGAQPPVLGQATGS